MGRSVADRGAIRARPAPHGWPGQAPTPSLKVSSSVFRNRSRHVLLPLVLALFVAPLARPAASWAREAAGNPASRIDPLPALPVAGDRVEEGSARFEVVPGTGARDVRVVIAHFPFDPTGWSSMPSGPAWTVVPYGAGPLPLGSLGIVDQTETRLWWAVVWTDPRTGALRGSEARDLTVVPRFANRVGSNGALVPSASGRLPEHVVARPGPASPGRAIELAAGYTLVRGGAVPALPAALRRPVAEPGAAVERGAYLVQFSDDRVDSAAARLARAGGEIVSPIAGSAYLVRMGADAIGRLRAAGGEPWITPYE